MEKTPRKVLYADVARSESPERVVLRIRSELDGEKETSAWFSFAPDDAVNIAHLLLEAASAARATNTPAPLDKLMETVRIGMIESARTQAMCLAAIMAIIEDHPRRDSILQAMREASVAPEAILATLQAVSKR